jgi:hypothetical protein
LTFCCVDLVVSGVTPSFILVEKSLRAKSDMMDWLIEVVGLVWLGSCM